MSPALGDLAAYRRARESYHLEVPACFNFGDHVVDRWASLQPDACALWCVGPGQVAQSAADHQRGDELVAELQAHVKRITAPYKYPREIEFLDELPKTVSGKIRRVDLRRRG